MICLPKCICYMIQESIFSGSKKIIRKEILDYLKKFKKSHPLLFGGLTEDELSWLISIFPNCNSIMVFIFKLSEPFSTFIANEFLHRS